LILIKDKQGVFFFSTLSDMIKIRTLLSC